MQRTILLFLSILFAYYSVISQTDEKPNLSMRDQALNVYLDCNFCDIEYFKTNFTLVNYVTDRFDADVYILVTSMTTGSGGTEYSMILRGLRDFTSMEDTLVFDLDANATQDLHREALLRYASLGLVHFLMKTPYSERLDIVYDDSGMDEVLEDKWKNWTFSIGGDARFINQKTIKSYGFMSDLYVGKITPEIKFESSTMFYFDESNFELYEEDSLVYSNFTSQRSFISSNLFVKSLGNHFGLGGVAEYQKSEYLNLKNQVVFGPAVEYNIFDYADATRKQCRFLYGITYQYSEYLEMTIYDKLEDNLFTQELKVLFTYVDSWGEVNASMQGSTHLDDFSRFAVGARTSASLYLGKGLSFNMSAGFSYIQDQLGLVKDAATPEDLLIGQREMASDYNYDFSFGFTFRFGSTLNNVVNPRFTGR